MNELKTNISTRINEQLYGSNFITCKNKLSVSNINTIKKDFDMFYNTALTYLSNHFDYEYSPLKFLEPLCLKSNLLLYQDIAKIIEVFGLVDVISLDEIFEEFTIIKPAIPTVSFKNNLTVYEKWLELLSIQKLKNFEILLEFILSIPPSNSHVERVFSMMKLKWTDVRNHCSVDLIKNELMITLNILPSTNSSCTDFVNLVKDDTAFLNAVKSQKKYNWKN